MLRKTALSTVTTLGVLLLAGPVFAQLPTETGLSSTASGAGYIGQTATTLSIGEFIGRYFIQPILGLVGLLSFVLTVYAAVMWMTSAGDEKKVGKAKDILRSVVLGAALLVAAYAISQALITALTTGSVTGPVTTQPAAVP